MTANWPFGDLIPLRYCVVLADPPWYFKNFSAKGEEKNPVAHYDCMDLGAIKALPVSHLVRPDSICIMWATAPLLPEAIETMAAWGFTFKSAWRMGQTIQHRREVGIRDGLLLPQRG